MIYYIPLLNFHEIEDNVVMVEDKVNFGEFQKNGSHVYHHLNAMGFGYMHVLYSIYGIKNWYKYTTPTKLHVKVNQ